MAHLVVSPILFLISAPSGAGKTTVSHRLLGSVSNLERVVTCTTRAPRGGEVAGVDYHFLDRQTFEQRVAAGEFLEHAEVYGNRYGTLKSSVTDRLNAGVNVLLAVDVQGAAAIRAVAELDSAIGRALVSVFLMPPSLEELGRRLRGRKEDTDEVVARRLGVARREMEQWREFDYVVVSDGMDDDLASMAGILSAERRRTGRTRELRVE